MSQETEKVRAMVVQFETAADSDTIEARCYRGDETPETGLGPVIAVVAKKAYERYPEVEAAFMALVRTMVELATHEAFGDKVKAGEWKVEHNEG